MYLPEFLLDFSCGERIIFQKQYVTEVQNGNDKIDLAAAEQDFPACAFNGKERKKQHHTDVFGLYSGSPESDRIPTGTWTVDKILERSGNFTGKFR